ncbi:MAG: hypothetical protein QG558_236 [Campylobacterota bacterium]|nr:hypothetical protein [Campylobacterota bacterium]
MRLFYYVHTGHRIGLDRFHRAVAIINGLGDVDITLLSPDYRIAAEAKDFGIKRSVGMDVVRNIPQIAQHGDKIIFDSAELNPMLLDDMSQFFSTFIRIGDSPSDTKHPNEFLISPYLSGEGIAQGVIVGEHYYEQRPKTIPMALFFGDDDYEKDLGVHQEMFASYKMDLLMGFYHFLGYEKALQDSFKTLYEWEEYDEVIRGTDVLVTASPMAVLQNLAGGGRPIYLQRPDYARDYIPLFESLRIPIVDGYDASSLAMAIDSLSEVVYDKLEQSEHKIIEFIRQKFNLG